MYQDDCIDLNLKNSRAVLFAGVHGLRSCCGLAGADLVPRLEKGIATLAPSSEKENARVCTIEVDLGLFSVVRPSLADCTYLSRA